jgi:farnesyl-diphosphate farnesyltransferase
MKQDLEYCKRMLPKVSRTFAPTINMLPKKLNGPVMTAYLLCRIADTVEDSEALSVEQKNNLLSHFIHIFTENTDGAEQRFNSKIGLLPLQTADDELAYNLSRVINVFRSYTPASQKHIGKWVVEMSRGMQKFAQSSQRRRFSFLKSMKELDEYTYYVAGTVGYLLTELFSYYSQKITPPLKIKLEQLAESFGKGLQMVNIIRDITVDLKRGQSYIPDDLLEKYKLTRDTVYHKENAHKVEKMFNELIKTAIRHLDQALNYILLIPKKETKIRIFCMLPLFWALRTLQKIQENTLALLGSEKVKIPKSIVRKEYFLALINMHSNRLIRWHYHNIRSNFSVLPASV